MENKKPTTRVGGGVEQSEKKRCESWVFAKCEDAIA
jgi:hypothetical protein